MAFLTLCSISHLKEYIVFLEKKVSVNSSNIVTTCPLKIVISKVFLLENSVLSYYIQASLCLK